MLKLDAKLKLEEVIPSSNVAEMLDKDDLHKIAEEVLHGYQKDKDSRYKWEYQTKQVIKLAAMEHTKKDTPFENASNVKDPLIATACLQFAAHTYPEIVRNGEVVHTVVAGDDPDNAKHSIARVISDHMNYQLLVESADWENSLDKLLHTLPLIGVAFKKTYYDPIHKKNISELCPYDEIHINANIKSLEEARRITHVLGLHRNTIIERIRYGIYSEIDEKRLDPAPLRDESAEDHVVLEQHCYLDLDKDGYEEPYVVTVLETTREVLRIIARFDPEDVERNYKNKIQCIHPIHYFTDYHCIPNPDGSYYSIGLGQLLFGSNHSINSLINQSIDAGSLSNVPTALAGRNFRIKGGEFKVKPGVINKVDTMITGKLSDEIHMIEFKPPSPVLLQLLQYLQAGAKELASINDVSTGNAQVQNVASSVMSAQMEQGMKVFTGIQRRLFRALKKEFEKLYRLNSIFLPPQQEFLLPGKSVPISFEDYKEQGIRIIPVADPNMASDELRMRRNQALLELSQNPLVAPHLNGYGIGVMICEDLKVSNIQQVLQPPDPNAPPPPEILQLQSDMKHKEDQIQVDVAKLQLQSQEAAIRAMLAESEAAKNYAQQALYEAQAGVARSQPALQEQKQTMDAVVANDKHETEILKEHIKAQAAKDAAKAKPKTGE